MRDVLKKLILDSEILCKTCGESTDSYCAEAIADLFLANGGVVMPCKVGDTIYLPWEFDGIKSIAGLTVTHVIFDIEHDYVKTDFHTDDEAYYDKYKCGSYEFEDFGKTVFLTREEAEQALKGGDGDG